MAVTKSRKYLVFSFKISLEPCGFSWKPLSLFQISRVFKSELYPIQFLLLPHLKVTSQKFCLVQGNLSGEQRQDWWACLGWQQVFGLLCRQRCSDPQWLYKQSNICTLCTSKSPPCTPFVTCLFWKKPFPHLLSEKILLIAFLVY